MSNEKDRKFFIKSIDYFRSKVLAKISDQEQRSRILAMIGTASRDINDFQPFLDLLEKLDPNELRSGGIRLTEAGFIDQARLVAKKINHCETAFDLLIHIAAASKEDSDFQKAADKIEDIRTELLGLNISDVEREIKIRTKDARRKLIEELARAGKYERAKEEIGKIEYGEFLHGVVSNIVIENSYRKEFSQNFIVNPEKVNDLAYAFRSALLSGDKEYAILALYLLCDIKEFDLARKLIEEISDQQYLCNYIKARCYIGLAIATHADEDANNAFKYGMLSVATDGRDPGQGADCAFEILLLLGTCGRSLYHLGLAYDLVLRGENNQYDIIKILAELSRLKL